MQDWISPAKVPSQRHHHFMTMVFIVLGLLVFGATILGALGIISPT